MGERAQSGADAAAPGGGNRDAARVGRGDGTAAGDAAILAITRPSEKLLWLYVLQALATLIAAPFVMLPLYFKYHTLRYRFDAEGISARWGILFRHEVYLTYKRIQDIHVKRNLVERWLGIGTVEVQTASASSSAELALEGLEAFEPVRDFLYRKMRGASEEHQAGRGVEPADAPLPEGADLVALLEALRLELAGARRALESRAG